MFRLGLRLGRLVFRLGLRRPLGKPVPGTGTWHRFADGSRRGLGNGRFGRRLGNPVPGTGTWHRFGDASRRGLAHDDGLALRLRRAAPEQRRTEPGDEAEQQAAGEVLSAFGLTGSGGAYAARGDAHARGLLDPARGDRGELGARAPRRSATLAGPAGSCASRRRQLVLHLRAERCRESCCTSATSALITSAATACASCRVRPSPR